MFDAIKKKVDEVTFGAYLRGIETLSDAEGVYPGAARFGAYLRGIETETSSCFLTIVRFGAYLRGIETCKDSQKKDSGEDSLEPTYEGLKQFVEKLEDEAYS